MTYDDLERLTKIEKKQSNTLVNSNAMSAYKTIAENEYDKLGQLKKKKLAPAYNSNAGLESLNYEYNIRGWMLGMNRDYAKDANSTNWFGFDLGYDKSNNGIIGNQSYANPQYNGNIEGMVWKSKGDGEKRKYDFYYDAANRLLRADFGQYTGGNFNTSAGIDYKMKMGDGINVSTAYDANGNILQMQQWGLKLTASVQIDNLSYTYESNSNKLSKVVDAITTENKLGDFYDGTNGTNTDYNYDFNGNLTLDNNKAINSITYNHLNLPLVVTVSGKGTISYTYDAAGNKLKKVTVDNSVAGKTITTTTVYIAGAVYESKQTSPADANDYTDRLQFIGHEEGRIRFKAAVTSVPASFEYDYFVKDHLGNVRVVLTEETKTDQYPAATLEPSSINTEDDYYGNLQNTQYSKPSWFSDPLYSTNAQVAQLKNTSGVQKIGPNIVLKVMAGDTYSLRVASGWSGSSATNNSTDVLTELLNLLSAGVANVSGGKVTQTELQSSGSGLNTALTNFLGQQTTSGSKPKAYISWILLDEQFKIAKDASGNMIASGYSGFEQVGSSGSTTIHYKPNLTVNKSGYLYIYTSNEATDVDVFFDNLQVTHVRGPLIEETHYYPFGLTMAGISSKALNFGCPENRRKYNGIEFDNDLDLNTYEAFFRNLDPQTGRWWEIDPEIENMEAWSPYASNYDNPITFNDPLGDEPYGDGGGDDPPKRSFWQGVKEGTVNFLTGVATPPIVTIFRVSKAAVNGDFKPAASLLVPAISKADDAVEFVKGDAQTKGRILTENGLEIGTALLGEKIIKVKGVEVKTPEVKTSEVKVGDYSNLKDNKSVGPGKKFTPEQKKAVLQENMKRNGGVIKSDASGKVLDQPVQSKKGVKANMNQAEIDHKNPKSKNGSNSYNNAQVLSKEENLRKSNN